MSRPRAVVAAAAVAVGMGVAVTAPALGQVAGEARSTGQPAASTDEDIRALEQQVQLVLEEARRQQALLATQRQRLAAAESVNVWLPWLFSAVAGLALVAGVLALRLRRAERQLARLHDAPSPVPSPAADPGVDTGGDTQGTRPPERPLLGGLGAGVVRMPDLALTQPGPGLAVARGGDGGSAREFGFGTGVPPRPVSVEELLDLDQQVEFFLALGQAQSAIDLLLGHVRSTGGTNAQPYFKLLEIYRAQGDEEAYERTRERFNQRFNAHAPAWSGDLAGGRSLEDYPEVIQRLQRAWPQPMRAVAELDGLLLRRADLEPLDLPAYRDVLMLHALVRDLPASPLSGASGLGAPLLAATTASGSARDDEPIAPVAGPVTSVDLLLPLGEHTHDVTTPQPHLADRPPPPQARLAEWVFSRSSRQPGPGEGDASGGPDRPPPPVRLDLDLSDYAPAPREFTRPAAFTDIDMRRDSRLSDLGGLDEAGSDARPPRR